jgi:hypothetical protein
LSNIPFVDYVLKLPEMAGDEDYEILVKKLEPDIIAVTSGNKVYGWEERYMEETGGKIVEVIKRLGNYSTTEAVRHVKL